MKHISSQRGNRARMCPRRGCARCKKEGCILSICRSALSEARLQVYFTDDRYTVMMHLLDLAMHMTPRGGGRVQAPKK